MKIITNQPLGPKPKVALSIFGNCGVSIDPTSRWGQFVSRIRSQGLEVVEISNSIVDYLVAVDHSNIHLKQVARKVPRSSRILILRESRSIRPDQFRARILTQYKYILSCSKKFDDKIATDYYNDGFLTTNCQVNQLTLRPRNSICMINENKFSLHKSSNYSLRQKLLEKLVQSEFNICVAGKNWTKKYPYYVFQQVKSALILLKSYNWFDVRQIRIPMRKSTIERIKFIGFVENKIDFLSKFYFVLIIENDNYRPTEKIFDAITAGCIPIYHGPVFLSEEVPSDIFVRLDDPKTFSNLIEQVYAMSEDDCSNIRNKGRNWLESRESARRWSEDQMLNNLSMMVSNLISK